MTDFDASGLLIAKKLPKQENIHWIGIRPEMVKELLSTEDISEVEEEYTPQNGHIDTLVVEGIRDDLSGDSTLRNWIPYLNEKRIEIDSVLAKISSEDLWNYILEKLEEKFPYRNYNRSINVDRCVMPFILEEFIDKISDRIAEIQAPRRENIIHELENVEGFIEDVDEKGFEITEDLRSVAEKYDKTKIKNMLIEEIDKLFD